MKHVSIYVKGKVQGVFFRASTKEKADALGVKGTIQNNADGSVTIEAEGEDQHLEQFVSWCRTGPRLARVDLCEVKEESLKDYINFSIVR